MYPTLFGAVRVKSILHIVLILMWVSGVAFAEEIRLGLLLPKSGDMAAQSKNVRRGVELALEELGGKLILKEAEDYGDQEELLSAYTQLVKEEKVQIVVGTMTSEETLAIAPQLVKDNIFLLTTAACDEKFSTFQNILCVVPSLEETLLPTLEYIFTKEKNEKNKVLSYIGPTEPRLRKTLEFIRVNSRKYGWQIKNAIEYPSNTKDFHLQLTELKKKPTSILILGESHPELQLALLSQAKELEQEFKTIVFLHGYPAEFFEEASSANTHAYFPAQPVVHQKFTMAFDDEFGSTPDMYAALSYDTTRYMINALRLAPTRDPQVLRRGMAKLVLESATGSFQRTSSGKAQFDMKPVTFREGKEQLVEAEVTPAIP
jgi:branched-chain amino acid transport system substrate-binding protein